MGLSSSLAIASSGLAALQSEMAVASQNVSNASTTGYVTEVSSVSARNSGSEGSGVVVGLTTRAVNNALETSLYNQNAVTAALQTTSDGLTTISALQGSTSADSDSSATLSDEVGNLQTSLTTLESDPSESSAQEAVVTAATTLASGLQTTSAAYQAARQSAQESIIDEVGTANATLKQIGTLSDQIVEERSAGQSTADLENQRASAMSTLSSVLSVRFQETSSGDMLVSTADGTSLPTHQSDGPLTTSDTTISSSSVYPDTIPGITLNGKDVTDSLTGGTLGGNISLRDQVLPTMQGELDSFSQALASRFDAQGLTLFVNSSGTVPDADDSSGFSSTITVNSSVSSDPSLVRDGTHDVTGSTTGASSFSVNTSRGSADTTLVDRLLTYALGSTVQTGVDQPAAATTGLGADGTLSAPYSGGTDLDSLATNLTSAQAATISDASNGLSSATALQTSLSTSIASASGVSVDDQTASIVALQNAYAANAKVITAVQTMFTALLTAIS